MNNAICIQCKCEFDAMTAPMNPRHSSDVMCPMCGATNNFMKARARYVDAHPMVAPPGPPGPPGPAAVLPSLEDLRGPPGLPGKDAILPPLETLRGPSGPPGETVQGPPGLSAYEVARANGLSEWVTEKEWLASLRGEPGKTAGGGTSFKIPDGGTDGQILAVDLSKGFKRQGKWIDAATGSIAVTFGTGDPSGSAGQGDLYFDRTGGSTYAGWVFDTFDNSWHPFGGTATPPPTGDGTLSPWMLIFPNLI